MLSFSRSSMIQLSSSGKLEADEKGLRAQGSPLPSLGLSPWCCPQASPQTSLPN